MDVLDPEVIWVDGKCYRFYESSLFSQEKEIGAYQEEEYEGNYSTEEEDVIQNVNITNLPNGKYFHAFDIPKYAFFAFSDSGVKI